LGLKGKTVFYSVHIQTVEHNGKRDNRKEQTKLQSDREPRILKEEKKPKCIRNRMIRDYK
jgi:hypothetical protein